MNNIIAIARRELGLYFIHPMAYIILTGLMGIFGALFYNGMVSASNASIPYRFDELLSTLSAVLVFVAPLITMRLMAEEKNKGTLEILMTAPVTETQVVLAKYFASLLFLAFLLTPTLAYAVLASKYGTIDVSATATGYLGVFLICSSIFSIGLFISALCENQMTAGVITFVISFLLILSSMLSTQLPTDVLGVNLQATVEALDPFRYLGDFLRGIIDTRPLVYFLTTIVFFLFLTVRSLESRRWR